SFALLMVRGSCHAPGAAGGARRVRGFPGGARQSDVSFRGDSPGGGTHSMPSIHNGGDPSMNHDSKGYWSATLGLLTKILIIWFLVSFGAGILFADVLNNIKLGGYPLGFWFAHQGSIYVFVVLIFYYARKMGQI